MTTTTDLTTDTIQQMVLAALHTVLEEKDATPPGELGSETQLLGKDAVIDSLGLVTLLVDLEQRLEEEYDVTVTLADERAMSQKNSPFRNIGALSEYITTLMAENGQPN